MIDIYTTAKMLVEAIKAMPAGYMSGLLRLQTIAVEEALENHLSIALVARCFSLLEGIYSYPMYRTTETLEAAELFREVIEQKNALLLASCPQ